MKKWEVLGCAFLAGADVEKARAVVAEPRCEYVHSIGPTRGDPKSSRAARVYFIKRRDRERRG